MALSRPSITRSYEAPAARSPWRPPITCATAPTNWANLAHAAHAIIILITTRRLHATTRDLHLDLRPFLTFNRSMCVVRSRVTWLNSAPVCILCVRSPVVELRRTVAIWLLLQYHTCTSRVACICTFVASETTTYTVFQITDPHLPIHFTTFVGSNQWHVACCMYRPLNHLKSEVTSERKFLLSYSTGNTVHRYLSSCILIMYAHCLYKW